MPSPPSLTSRRFNVKRALLVAALTLVALAVGPWAGSAWAVRTITVDDSTATEGASVVFTVACTDDNVAPVCNGFQPSGTTVSPFGANPATAGADFTGGNYPVSSAFTASGQTRTFSVPTATDGTDEPNPETFQVTLSEGADTATGNITDIDPRFTITGVSGGEGALFQFAVTVQSAITQGAVQVQVNSSSLTASEGPDFSGGDTTVIFSNGLPAGTQRFVPVNTFCDGLTEGNEQFQMTLSNPSAGSSIGNSTALGTIFDGCTGQFTGPGADLLMIKEESADPIAVGSELIYTLRVHNLCTPQACNAAGGVTVFDPLPTGVEYVSATPSQGSCSAQGTPTTIACSLGVISVNSIPFVQVRVKPTTAADLSNTAGVTASTFDPNTANNQATTITRSFTGSTAPPPAENPTEDVTAPIANLSGPRRCFVLQDGSCGIEVRSSENGTAEADGSVIIGPVRASTAQRRRVRRVFFFRGVRRSIEANQEEVLPLRVGRRARRAIRRALRSGRGVRARVEVIVADQDGNERVRRRTLRIVG